MRQPTIRDLWRARDQLATCLRLATEAKRKGESTYESCFTLPRGWRDRGQKTVLLHGLRMDRERGVVSRSYPRLQWLRGDVGKTLAIGPFRLARYDRLLRHEYGLDDAGWHQLLLDRETPCARCQVRYWGGMDRYRQSLYGETGLDPLDPDRQDFLDFDADQEASLLEHGFIKQADYAAFERSRQ